MKRFYDLNCMVGGWPFHRVRNSTFEDLKRLHAKLGICGGLVSSTDAIFWNDPYEADRILAKTLEGQQDYKHIMTVNPTLAGWRDDLARAEREFNCAGVRVVPGFHGYTLDHPEMQALAEELAKRNLPLLVNIHMEDERIAYLLMHRPIPADEIAAFINKNPDLRLMLANIRISEVIGLRDVILSSKNVFCDISGFKDYMFGICSVVECGVADRLVYGSMSPLFCVTSTALILSDEPIDEEIADKIRSGAGFADKA